MACGDKNLRFFFTQIFAKILDAMRNDIFVASIYGFVNNNIVNCQRMRRHDAPEI